MSNAPEPSAATGNGIAIYRFFLAASVFYHHTLYFSADDRLRFGASAVIGFYVVSGYLNGRSLSTFSRRTSRPRLYFLIDRFLRMGPVHFTTGAAALVLTVSLGGGATNWIQALSNLLIAPLFLTGVSGEHFGGYLGLAWTLGTEYVFYAILPLFALLPARLRKAAFFALLVSYCWLFYFGSFNHIRLARKGLGFESNFLFLWCYQLPFLTFWFFALGDFVRRRETLVVLVAAGLSLVFMALFAAKVQAGGRPIPFSSTLLVGWGLSLPLMWLAARVEFRGWTGRVATFLGDLTLPLYLGHGLARLATGQAGKSVAAFDGMVLMWTLTFFVTLAMYALDKGANGGRYAFREWFFRRYPLQEG